MIQVPLQSLPSDDALLLAALRREGPVNLPRAYEVMDQFNLQGLVLGDPLNVFHLLGYWPQLANTRVGQPPTTFALLSRDPRQTPGLVMSRFMYYYSYADGEFARDLQVHLYQEVGDSDASAALDLPRECADQGRAPLSRVELRRRAQLDAALQARVSVADSAAALRRAMREMGLWQGRIAFDHDVIRQVCNRHQHPGEMVPAENILRWIRLVKSPLEIALMRRAASANAAALIAVGQGVRANQSYQSLQQSFLIEAAKRGNRAVFLNVDRVSSELVDERVVDGQTLFLDAVSHYMHYHGDYARTVFVGEPLPAAREAAQAAALGWRAIRDTLKPGLRYSQLVATGQDAIRRSGFAARIGFGPHSVGLMHTDEPGEESGGFHRKLDLTLRENMILSVDCPVLDTGVGGSAHIEDLMLITASGAEPIHEIGEAVLRV